MSQDSIDQWLLENWSSLDPQDQILLISTGFSPDKQETKPNDYYDNKSTLLSN